MTFKSRVIRIMNTRGVCDDVSKSCVPRFQDKRSTDYEKKNTD